MSVTSLYKNPTPPFQAVIWLEKRLSFHAQRSLLFSAVSFSLLGFAGWFLLAVVGIDLSSVLGVPVLTIAEIGLVVGIIAGVIALLMSALHGFYLYYWLSSIADDDTAYTYPAAVWLQSITQKRNPLVTNRFGRELLLRTGIDPQHMAGKPDLQSVLNVEKLRAEDKSVLTLDRVLQELFGLNQELEDWLFDAGVDTQEAVRAARWVERRNQRWVRTVRFWSPERLADLGRIGRQLNYGKTPKLDDFTTYPDAGVFVGARGTSNAFTQNVDQLFNILTRPRSANAILVGSQQGGVNDVIREVDNRLQTKEAPKKLADYQVRELSLQSIITTANSGPQLEQLLSEILGEAIHAGNILLVIKDLPRLLAAGEDLSVDMFTVLGPFIKNKELPVLATARADDYYQSLQNSEFMQWFGSVEVTGVESDTLLTLLEEVAERSEGEAVCTVSGLETIIRLGREVITDDQMPHAAIDLLLEILQQSAPGEFIDQDRVSSYVSNQTDLPLGEIDEGEQEKLSHLEESLHNRVIGQDAAITAVSSALRRSRAGLEDSRQPIGSFLFLGPTGVGKTETAKAVSDTYFDAASVTMRFDMSEFTTPQSMAELIGDGQSAGRLSSEIRSQQHGVLLLDEFEKAHTSVHDLFLQILDEGYFTDGSGREVSCSNVIIIATSNAGASQIFSLVSDNENPSDHSREIIDDLIADNAFRPELLNRFTEIVVFHPLNKTQLTAVTEKFLDQLKERLKTNQGVRLRIEDGVAAELADAGYDPEFGARAVKRYLQQTVENIIADKIIARGTEDGQEINLSVTDVRSADPETDTSATTQ
jgi:ATP-dependent Clp protease ATP-binding subunit ClpA